MTKKSLRGHSWNVNTKKESSILQSPDLCHASIFHFSFFLFLWGRQKMEPNICTVIFSGPLFCPSPHAFVISPLCHYVFGQCFCHLHPYNDTSILFSFFVADGVKFHSMYFLPSERKSWFMIRTFYSLDCMVAVADVGLLCGETWKRRMKREIKSQGKLMTWGRKITWVFHLLLFSWYNKHWTKSNKFVYSFYFFSSLKFWSYFEINTDRNLYYLQQAEGGAFT